MRRALRDRRRALRDETGISLVEMIITAALVTVLGGLLFTSVLSINRAVGVADAVTFDQAFGRNSLSLISRDVRAAADIPLSSEPAFQLATPYEVEFTALLSTGQVPDLVEIDVDADSRIVVTQTSPQAGSIAPDYVYAAADARPRYVASFIVNELLPTPVPIFVFRDDTGAELTDFTGPGGNLTEAQRQDIASVDIVLILNSEPIITGVTQLQTAVRLPNAGGS